MEVLEPEDQGTSDAMTSTASANSRSIRSPRDAVCLSLECPQLRGIQNRGHLGEPRRSVLAEQAGDRLPSWLAAQAGHGFQQRQVGLARPMSLDASTLGDSKPIATLAASAKNSLDGRRLPDPGLAGHEDDLPIPIRGPLQAPAQLAQLPVPTDDQRRRRSDAPATARHWRGPGAATGARERRTGSPAVPRFDEARAPGVVGERALKLLDACRERRITDDRVPHTGLEQLVSRDQLPARSMSAPGRLPPEA